MFKIIPFEPSHLDAFEINCTSKAAIDNLKKIAIHLKQSGPCFTAVYRDRIIGCGGLSELWPGVAQAWAAFEKGAPMFKVHKVVKQALTTLMRDCRYHRIQANTPENFEIGKKWLSGNGKSKGLGFKKEAVMSKFGPNQEDFVQYARII